MYFLWCLQGTSCDVVEMKHALPVLGHGQILNPLLHPSPSLVGLDLGVFLGGESGVGLGSNLKDYKEKDPVLSGSSPSKHTKSVNSPGREGWEMELVKTTGKDPHSHLRLLCACLCLRGFVSLSLVSQMCDGSDRPAWPSVEFSEPW